MAREGENGKIQGFKSQHIIVFGNDHYYKYCCAVAGNVRKFCTQDASTIPPSHSLTFNVLLHVANIILNMYA